MNPSPEQETLQRVLQLLAHGSDVVLLVGKLRYEIELGSRSDVIQAIMKREKDIASGIEKSSTPWAAVSSIGWVPKLLDSKRIQKAIGKAFQSTESPWYLLNVLKDWDEVLLTNEVLKGITKALQSCKRFWEFIDHMKTLPELIEHAEVRKSVRERAGTLSSELLKSSSPLSMIHSIKIFPEVFAEESVKGTVLTIIEKHEEPWEFLQAIETIEHLDYIRTHPRIIEVLEQRAGEIVEKLEQSSEIYGNLRKITKIPELARTQAICSFLCKQIATSNTPSLFIGMLSANEELAGHPDCQEAAARELIASSEPWDIISSATYSPALLESPGFVIAIRYRVDDVIQAFRDFKQHDSFSFVSDVIQIVGKVDAIGERKDVEKLIGKYISGSDDPKYLIEKAIKETSLCEKPAIQKAIAKAIQRSKDPLRIINVIDGVNHLIESDIIQGAIRSRSQDILAAITGQGSVTVSGLVSRLIEGDAIEEALVTRLIESKRSSAVLDEIFKSQEIAKSKTIFKGIAQSIRELENPSDILMNLTRFTKFDERWRAIMDLDVLDAIAEYIETTSSLSNVLKNIGWEQYGHLLLVHEPIEKALEKRIDDFVKLIAENHNPADIIAEIHRIPILSSNEQILNGVANAIRNPRYFRDVIAKLYGLTEHTVILQAMKESAGTLVTLLEKEEYKDWVLRDAFHPVMLNNVALVDWFVKNMDEPQFITFLLNKDAFGIPKIRQGILRLMRESEPDVSIHIAVALLYMSFLIEFPEYRKEVESIFENVILRSDAPWNIHGLHKIIETCSSQQIQKALKKRIPDIVRAIKSSKQKQTDRIIGRITKIEEWFTDEAIVDAIATTTPSLDSSAILSISFSEYLVSQKVIQDSFIQLIRDTSDVIYKLGLIHSEKIHALEEFQSAVFSRINDIARTILETKNICHTLKDLENCYYVLKSSEVQDVISQRIDDIIAKTARSVYFSVKDYHFIDSLVNNPTIFNLILQSIKESHEPWDIIRVVKENQLLMQNKDILQAIKTRTEFIARVIEKGKDPQIVFRMIQGVDIVTQDPSVSSAICARGLEGEK